MNFQMEKRHHTRAKHMLRAWGEFKRVERDAEACNGLQSSTVFKDLLGGRRGDMAEFEDDQLTHMVLLMSELKRTSPMRYRYAEYIYRDQKAVTALPVFQQRQCQRSLQNVREYIFVNMWPEVVKLEQKLRDENKFNEHVYNWDSAQVVTTGKRDNVRPVDRVVVYRK